MRRWSERIGWRRRRGRKRPTQKLDRRRVARHKSAEEERSTGLGNGGYRHHLKKLSSFVDYHLPHTDDAFFRVDCRLS